MWATQKPHVPCIQDPTDIPLYTHVSHVKKGTKTLPTYRCARGSTSLESFHLHIARFIPGTSASDMHFQAYLLEGLARWNEDRATVAAHSALLPGTQSYDMLLRHSMRAIGEEVWHEDLLPGYFTPANYTGELIGVDYLYSQTGKVLNDFTLDPDGAEAAQLERAVSEDEDAEVDEGFVEIEDEDPTAPPVTGLTPESAPSSTATLPQRESASPESPSGEAYSTEEVFPGSSSSHTVKPSPTLPCPGITLEGGIDYPEESVGPDNVAGFDKVKDISCFLFDLRNTDTRALTNSQADQLISLWNNLSPHDKRPARLEPRFKEKLGGRFKARTSTATQNIPGVDSTRRNFMGQCQGPSQWPNANRYMESLVVKLCLAIPGNQMVHGIRFQRWNLICSDYKKIEEAVRSNARVMSNTRLQLLGINKSTASQWYNRRGMDLECQLLDLGVHYQAPQMEARRPLATSTAQSAVPPPPVQVPQAFQTPQNTTDTIPSLYLLGGNRACPKQTISGCQRLFFILTQGERWSWTAPN